MIDLSHYAEMARLHVQEATCEWMRPSVLYRPTLSADGTKWCALYGDNLQEGVAGFGDTPHQAMINFDIAWLNERTPLAAKQGGKS